MKAWRGTVRVAASLAALFAPLALLTALALLASTAFAACPAPPAGASVMADGPVQAAWQAEAGAIAVGRPFAIIVLLCPADAQLQRVDASMPEHRHGMNYKTTVTSSGAGKYRAEGLMFHMPGRWEYIFEVRAAGATERLTTNVVLP